ncbi:alpha/beta hydrolase [Nonomuraea endophytica]|uniref:Acetyl esterase/lipase n=1 Tax=Nonomuraea endophytica TaxID=714136 RepID=A0A7W8A1F0_9ACTN|nr:alpha/beta hydrolase [Nonomuraea endophytica]MBB5077239.1 acetyl esterase/lipase [Nonomuraea endophytica]
MSTPPPFDPELTAALDMFGAAIPSSISADMIQGMREARASMPQPSDEELARDGALVIADHTAPGPEGAPDITLLVARPAAAAGAIPAIYFIHGGGMMFGDRRLGMPDLGDLALELGVAIVSVEYRLAPEHPHPAPVEDCYAGLEWTAKNAAELGIDPARVIVGGASAGGGLAAAVVLLARDRGGPAILGQLLVCPMLDDRNDSPSSHQMAGLGIWDRTANETGWTALLGPARGTADVSPYAAPARATDLSGLPPTFIDVGSAETFRDEDVDYAVRVWRDGGRAELHVWPGGFHGFDGLAPQAALSQDAKEARLRWLRRLLGG